MTANELFLASLRSFRKAWNLSGDELRFLQQAKLWELMRHVVQHVPLYRDLYREQRIDMETIVTAGDLWRLPSVTKNDYLRAGPGHFVDERKDLGRLRRRTTSGTTGPALAIYNTPVEGLQLRASLWSAWLSRGVTRNDRLFMMSAPYLAVPIEPIRSDFAPVQMPIEEVVERFRALQPTAIIGPVEAIALLAVEVHRHDLPERRGVRRIFPFGQTLSVQLEEMIRRGFDAEIFDLYGATETTWIAGECERHDGLHVNEDRVITQVARFGHPDEPAAPGELGEVIVTSLMRTTMPFIRYRLHDAAALDPTPCPCGRSGPRLMSLEGRVQDFLLSTTGRWVGPSSIAIDLSAGQKAFVDYRIVQEAPDRVRVSVVPAPHFGEQDRQRIQEVILRKLGAVTIAIDSVEEIPREASGKRRRIHRTFDIEMIA